MSNSQTEDSASVRSTRSSARNPKRRQRQSDGDTLKTAAPRRKRSKLSESTFAPRGPEEVENNVLVMNGDAHSARTSRGKRDSTPSRTDLDLPVRGKRGSLKRIIKGDGSKLLAQNKTYSVKLLPSTPRELTRDGIEYRGSLGAGHHALAVTREKAMIWDYTGHTPVSNAREFSLPFQTKPAESLPFGALISTGGAELGLVLISAVSGKIVFYESIERAVSLGLFQERQTGVEGSLGSIYSGETVVELSSADHAGFIVTLSSGRIFHIKLRDNQGKPRISAQLLRAETDSTGFFGSIKGFLGSMGHKDVTAVHTRALETRGQIQVVALTTRSQIEIWDLDWSGPYEYKASIDFREMIVNELKDMFPPESQSLAENITAVDFAIPEKPQSSRSNEVATLGAEQPLDIWILFKLGQAKPQQYILAEISFNGGNDAALKRFQELEPYHGYAQDKPRLILPKPGHTGYIAFEDAVTLFATADVAMDGPEAQLHASYQDLRPFEDSVYLRTSRDVVLLSAVAEEVRSGHASSIGFVKNAGLVRFSAIDPAGDVERTRISAKEKIEQAVFYGQKEDNIIDFSRKGDSQFPAQEVESAAVAISDEILRSESSVISKQPTMIEEHLSIKARYLRTLISYVVQNYPGLSKRTLWSLLWDAEKLAAGQELWKTFEEHKAASGAVKRTATVMDDVCTRAQEEYGWAKFDTMGDELVSKVFIHALDHLGELLSLIQMTLGDLRSVQQEEPNEKVARIVKESDELWIRAMKTVFSFRDDNADLYSLPHGFIVDGLLKDATTYPQLPEFWTSTDAMVKAISNIASHSRELADGCFQEEATPVHEGRIHYIVTNNPRLIELFVLVFQERIFWLESRESAKYRDNGHKLREQFGELRREQIMGLMNIGQTDAGMSLAEKYKDMDTLTELVVADTQYMLEEQSVASHTQVQMDIVKRLEELIKRTGRYFDKFGDDWANAFFDQAFSSSRAGYMLEEAQQKWPEALATYLRAQKSRAKICWLNDVTVKHDFEHAGRALLDAATSKENKLWAKKVELSMSKLALLAAGEGTESNNQDTERELALPRRELLSVQVQEQLYDHLHSTVVNGIDKQAQVELAMTKFGTRNQELGALRQLLETDLERVLGHDVLSLSDLIDVLTLIDVVLFPAEETAAFQGSEFYTALSALDAAAPGLSQRQFELTLKLIWKRCYLYDDWNSINGKHGTKKMTNMTEQKLQKILAGTTLWQTMRMCFEEPLASIEILRPSDCLGAACREEDLADRFPQGLLEPLVKDNQIQDEELQHLIADRRLEDWTDRCLNAISKAVDSKADEEEVVNGVDEAHPTEEEDGDAIRVAGSDGDVSMVAA